MRERTKQQGREEGSYQNEREERLHWEKIQKQENTNRGVQAKTEIKTERRADKYRDRYRHTQT